MNRVSTRRSAEFDVPAKYCGDYNWKDWSGHGIKYGREERVLRGHVDDSIRADMFIKLLERIQFLGLRKHLGVS